MKVTNTFRQFWKTEKRIVIHRGGTSSGKTRASLQAIANWLITGTIRENIYLEKGICSIVRQFAAELNKSVVREFEEVLENNFGIKNLKNIRNKTERTYKINGRIVEFFGADDPEKLKGPRRDILFVNEANNISFSKAFFQLNIRTRQLVILDFNPDDEEVWINQELEQKRMHTEKDVDLIVSTFRDNPYLSDIEVKEILNIRNIDKALWKVYGNGQYGKLEGAIFQDIVVLPKIPEEARLIGRGLDFGFTNDPSALIAGYKWNDGIVLDEEIYTTGLTATDLVGELRLLDISTDCAIWADNARPEMIEAIYRAGFNIKGAKKGAGSINYGITVMKQQKIYITARSINLIREFKKYIWKLDKEGKATNTPIDKFNHGIDGARYLIVSELNQEETINIRFG